MRVLVTGSQGYVGVNLVHMLRFAGMEVVGLDSDLYRGCNYGRVPPGPDWLGDIRTVTARDLAGFDAVVHLAGLSNDPLGDIDPSLTDAINRKGTVALAKAAREAGVTRFLFSSSCSNYGASAGGWLTETCPVNPITPYAVSKLQSERELTPLATDNFSPVFLRSGTAFGYSPRLRFDLVVNNLTAWAVATGDVRLKSDGSAWRPLVHVSDMAQAFLTVLKAPREKVHCEAFNVGSATGNMQIRDVAKIVAEEVPGAKITFASDACADERTYRVATAKLETLGYAAQISVRDGVRELHQAFLNHGVDVADFEGTRYQRVRHVLSLMQDRVFGTDLMPMREAAA